MKINIPGWGIASVPDDFESWETAKQEALIEEIKRSPPSSGYKTNPIEETGKKIIDAGLGIWWLFVYLVVFGFGLLGLYIYISAYYPEILG